MSGHTLLLSQSEYEGGGQCIFISFKYEQNDLKLCVFETEIFHIYFQSNMEQVRG